MNPLTEELPFASHFKLEELQQFALHEALAQHGAEDTVAFLAANHVVFKATFRLDDGITICIISVTPRVPA